MHPTAMFLTTGLLVLAILGRVELIKFAKGPPPPPPPPQAQPQPQSQHPDQAEPERFYSPLWFAPQPLPRFVPYQTAPLRQEQPQPLDGAKGGPSKSAEGTKRPVERYQPYQAPQPQQALAYLIVRPVQAPPQPYQLLDPLRQGSYYQSNLFRPTYSTSYSYLRQSQGQSSGVKGVQQHQEEEEQQQQQQHEEQIEQIDQHPQPQPQPQPQPAPGGAIALPIYAGKEGKLGAMLAKLKSKLMLGGSSYQVIGEEIILPAPQPQPQPHPDQQQHIEEQQVQQHQEEAEQQQQQQEQQFRETGSNEQQDLEANQSSKGQSKRPERANSQQQQQQQQVLQQERPEPLKTPAGF